MLNWNGERGHPCHTKTKLKVLRFSIYFLNIQLHSLPYYQHLLDGTFAPIDECFNFSKCSSCLLLVYRTINEYYDKILALHFSMGPYT